MHSSEYHLHRLFGDLEQRLNILRPLLKIRLVLELHLLWQAALHHGDDLLEFIECIMRHNFLVGANVVRRVRLSGLISQNAADCCTPLEQRRTLFKLTITAGLC